RRALRHERREAPVIFRHVMQYLGGDRLHDEQRDTDGKRRYDRIDDEALDEPGLRLAQREQPLEDKQRQERQGNDVHGIVSHHSQARSAEAASARVMESSFPWTSRARLFNESADLVRRRKDDR